MSSSVADGADGNAALHFYIHIDICKHMELLREAVFMNIYAVFRLNVSCLTLERLSVGARQQNPERQAEAASISALKASSSHRQELHYSAHILF